MTAAEKYNALNGKKVSRTELAEIIELAQKQEQNFVVKRLTQILESYNSEFFEISVENSAIDTVSQTCLPGLDFCDPEEFEDEESGLQKAVSPDEIYQMITDKMLEQFKKASGKGYKKKWKLQNDEGYLLPFNFESKKPYRGVNIMLLTEGMSKVLKNPFFLTFKQIVKLKGKLKEGSKGLPVVYFTKLYHVEEKNPDGKDLNFGTYNKAKFLEWLQQNQSKLKYGIDYYKNRYIPILKYYKIFNGADIEGIDFDLENFKIGFQDGSWVEKNNDSRVQIADLIIRHYPKPQPLFKDSKNGKAYYSFGYSVDEIHMPKIEDFETGLDYYRTLLHEVTHSTGIPLRLQRPMSGKFGSKDYAKEELVAEFGAVFLSAQAGIIWYNNSNHAEYLKNWNNVLTIAKDDNRFIMRAASAAQAATDFVLNLDKDGIPAYQKEFLKVIPEIKASAPEKKKNKVAVAKVKPKKNKSASGDKKPRKAAAKKTGVKTKTPDTNELLNQQRSKTPEAKNIKEFERELRKLGFDIFQSETDKTSANEWERKYKLNYKDIVGFELLLKVAPNNFKKLKDKYSAEADYNLFEANLGMSRVYDNLEDFYSEVLEELQADFRFSLKEGQELKKEYSNTLFKKKDTAQLGLFGTAEHKDTVAFNKDILGAKRTGISSRKFISMGKTKGILKEQIGDLAMTIAGNVIKKAMVKDADHIAGWEHFINLPDNLNNPIAVFRSQSKGFVVVTELKNGKNKPLMAALHINEKFKITKIASLYARRNTGVYKKWAEEGKLMYAKEKSLFDYKLTPIAAVQKDSSKKRNKPLSKNKSSKKTNNDKEKGLNSPVLNPVPQAVATVQPQEVAPIPQKPRNVRSMASSGSQTPGSFFDIPGEEGKFLQAVEKKPVHSVVITLDGEQGAGKTTTLYKFMNSFAAAGKVLFASLEEHPDSSLAIEKTQKYINPQLVGNIDVIGELESDQELYSLIPHYDFIFIDSWQKLLRMIGNIRLDEDLRKKFNGKVFIIIFQQTTDGRTKGGAEVVFDGDIIIKMVKEAKFAENYAYFDKNRYTKVPLETLRYNIATGMVYNPEGEDVSDVQFEEINENPANSSINQNEVRLIATPIL